jgi:hypothetical protein
VSLVEKIIPMITITMMPSQNVTQTIENVTQTISDAAQPKCYSNNQSDAQPSHGAPTTTYANDAEPKS